MLVVDIGNSRIKWAWWQGESFEHSGAVDYSEADLAAVLDQHWPVLEQRLSSTEASVWVACVAGVEVEQQLQQWLQQHYHIQPVFLRSTQQLGDVQHSYADPKQHGVDRWAACLGARARYGSAPLCIIDCGTAVTVDLLDEQGRHQGGRIMPGLDMMRTALAQNTEVLDDQTGECTDFATGTADAITSGTLHMLSAAIDEVCSSARQRLGESMKIIITGGSSERLRPLIKTTGLCPEPWLVLHGLVYAAQQ